jgi:hypothetical protein
MIDITDMPSGSTDSSTTSDDQKIGILWIVFEYRGSIHSVVDSPNRLSWINHSEIRERGSIFRKKNLDVTDLIIRLWAALRVIVGFASVVVDNAITHSKVRKYSRVLFRVFEECRSRIMVLEREISGFFEYILCRHTLECLSLAQQRLGKSDRLAHKSVELEGRSVERPSLFRIKLDPVIWPLKLESWHAVFN